MSHNKEDASLAMCFARFGFILCCLINVTCFGACSSDDEDDGFFGNATICHFKEAVEGTEAIDPKDIAFLNAVEETRLINRWYGRLLGGRVKEKISDITNESTGIFGTLTPPVTSVQDSVIAFLLAGGYVWQHWGAELELFIPKKITLTESPIFTGLDINGTITFKQVALLFNVQYIIPRWFSWYPSRLQIHLDAGAGVSLRLTEASTLNPDGSTRHSHSKQTITPAANLCAGARYQVSEHFLVGVDYRYIYLGKAQIGPVDEFGFELQAKKTQVNGFFYGLTYQF